jgi:hypothetical protein
MGLCLVTRGWEWGYVLPDMRTNKVAKNGKIGPKICRLLTLTSRANLPLLSVNPGDIAALFWRGVVQFTLPHCFQFCTTSKLWGAAAISFKAAPAMLTHPKNLVFGSPQARRSNEERRLSDVSCIYIQETSDTFALSTHWFKDLNSMPNTSSFKLYFLRFLFPVLLRSIWERKRSG